METNNKKNIYIIFVSLFVILNWLNTYFLTTQTLNKYIAPFKHTFLGDLNAFIGNMAIIFLVVFITHRIFKHMRNRMLFLITVTLVVNFILFALGVFTLFFGTSFSGEAFIIFNNPAEGFASSTLREIFHELVQYYRIVVFIPFFTLLGYFIWAWRKKYIHAIYPRNNKHFLIGVLAISIMWFFSSSTFIRRFREDLPIESTIPTYAVQNYGLYPYYLGELVGVNYHIDLKSILEIDTEEDLANLYQTYNKNQSSYVNYFNGKTYSNRLTTDQATSDLYVDSEIADGNNLHGILEDKNLVLIHLESLNYFLLEFMEKEAAKGNSEIVEEAVDFMHNIFEQSFVFENIYNNVGMGVSSDGELSVLTGVNPHGQQTLYWKYNDMPYELDSLPNYFNQKDYDTDVIHGDAAAFYNRDVVYPNMYGFDTYYSIEDFIENGTNIDQGYLYDMVNDSYLWSPWVSDYELADYVYQTGSTKTNPFFMFPITMMGHTPFDFGPYEDFDLYPDYDATAFGDIFGITKRYINYGPYYMDIIKRFFVGDGNTDQTLDDTVYIFYSDHGSDLKSGNLSTIMDVDYNILNERQMLEHIVSFIYVPSNDTYVDYGDYQLRKGLLTGTQPLVRSEIDLYRTIVELFNLDADGDLYFGVNGLSDEPTFSINNRLEDVVLDDYFFSMRDINQVYPTNQEVDLDTYEYILKYKLAADYMLTEKDMQGQVKEAISNVFG